VMSEDCLVTKVTPVRIDALVYTTRTHSPTRHVPQRPVPNWRFCRVALALDG